MVVSILVVGCNKTDDPDNGGGNEINGHEFVDLGLPSGILWATCNVGADTPEGYGDYFAWGETASKELYDWKSYRYGYFRDDHYALNKYCTDLLYGLNGFVDGLTLLEPADDAATANWGIGWCTPTIEEWEELFLNTTGKWTTQNGVKGWHITATNGNALFLPAAGYWWDDAFNADLGLYWSSSVNKEFPYRSWGFHFNSDSSHLCGSSDRNRGQVVRAVCVR
jgi:hypothetical protein